MSLDIITCGDPIDNTCFLWAQYYVTSNLSDMMRDVGTMRCHHRTNISILQEIGIKKRLSALVQSRILKFFGHISRESDSIERLVVQGKVEGTRGRGRSPMRWPDQIKSAVGGPLHEYTRLSASRETWRMLAGRVTSALKDAS
ncbi:jg11986 [Pararge aegeria aegeria]|uniref:Jg11986 protein n=1 Tax=Pararge aegeria aegeria TaxID=348720 RepID=A0A8S4R4U3_9NEOP|nr:jg11986 [Pararge aegeria aegeria]